MTVSTTGSRRIIASAYQTARQLGLIEGMPVAQAQALVPDLHVMDADPEGEAKSLLELAKWAIRFSPVVALDPPDGLWTDIAGVEHLFGGEEALLTTLLGRLENNGIQALAAIADVPGAAWAVARYGKGGIVPPGRTVDAHPRLDQPEPSPTVFAPDHPGYEIHLKQTDLEWMAVITAPRERSSVVLGADREGAGEGS